jgi:calnexin
MGIGIEIWTMQAGIMFDSFYVGHSLDDAFQLADESFALKKKIEDASAEEEQAKEDEAAEENNPDKDKFATKAKKQWDKISVLLNEFMAAAVVDPVEAFKTYPVTGASVVFAFLAPTILYFLLGGSSKKNEVEKEEKEEKDDQAKKDD